MDLQHTLMLFLDACRKSQKMEYIERLSLFHGLMSFKNASYLFYSVIKEADNSIPLCEIEDAMFRVSWIPATVDDAELCQPWPLVLVDLATQVSDYYSQMDKKKAVI